jgi:hypothetical protein
MLNTTDRLKDRVEVRKRELQMKLAELKSDTRNEAISARNAIKTKLDELEEALKGGWDRMHASVQQHLEHWLEK